MQEIIINLCGGATCGGMIVLFITTIKNFMSLKDEEKIPTKDIFMKFIMGIIMGAVIGIALFTEL